ncbi:MAG: hypothetical protein K0Q79_847 [Flavipsychrobacter sp.]|jgi:uncharacterized membrane protein|nr:hypothetical protein [Flavipsychrobacter sp.]
MEKRAIGLVLTVLGIISLIIGGYTFVNHTGNTYNIKLIIATAVLGIVFFTAGINLVRSTKDTLKNNERVG